MLQTYSNSDAPDVLCAYPDVLLFEVSSIPQLHLTHQLTCQSSSQAMRSPWHTWVTHAERFLRHLWSDSILPGSRAPFLLMHKDTTFLMGQHLRTRVVLLYPIKVKAKSSVLQCGEFYRSTITDAQLTTAWNWDPWFAVRWFLPHGITQSFRLRIGCGQKSFARTCSEEITSVWNTACEYLFAQFQQNTEGKWIFQ